MKPSAADIFCDHLSVTYSPANSVGGEVSTFLLGLGAQPEAVPRAGARLLRVGRGTVLTESRSTWVKLTASGAALAYLRAEGRFFDYLSLLAGAPHRVTRLDAAVDLAVDYPAFRPTVESAFPRLRAMLGRKQVACTEILERRDDGELTGTYYAGKRGRTRQVLKVYDKAQEALAKRGEWLPPTTRVELECGRKVGATLRDAAEPASIFFHFVPPTLVSRPVGVADWVSHDLGGWAISQPLPTAYEALERLVDRSVDITAMRELADQLGPMGRRYLLGMVADRLALSPEDLIAQRQAV
jgi:hypothetical protein